MNPWTYWRASGRVRSSARVLGGIEQSARTEALEARRVGSQVQRGFQCLDSVPRRRGRGATIAADQDQRRSLAHEHAALSRPDLHHPTGAKRGLGAESLDRTSPAAGLHEPSRGERPPTAVPSQHPRRLIECRRDAVGADGLAARRARLFPDRPGSRDRHHQPCQLADRLRWAHKRSLRDALNTHNSARENREVQQGLSATQALSAILRASGRGWKRLNTRSLAGSHTFGDTRKQTRRRAGVGLGVSDATDVVCLPQRCPQVPVQAGVHGPIRASSGAAGSPALFQRQYVGTST